MATIDDISKWKITIIDTLSSLMNPKFGNWAPEMVINKCVYVRQRGKERENNYLV